MRFDFFTLGGSQLWEDIFFYQKWRIQRHFESKKCRLLDPWDIKRFQGSFDECTKAFFKYIEIYELPRQKGHMIVMLHGLFDSKNIFKPLWRAALANKFSAAAVNYPSTQKSISAHASQIETFLNNLVDISEVSFVTKGIGALVLRELLSRTNSEWFKKLKVGRIVEIAPPNQGSRLCAKLAKSTFFNLIFGPSLKDAEPKKVAFIPNIDPKYELGIIDCGNWCQYLIQLLPEQYRHTLFADNEAFSENAKEIVKIKSFKFNQLNNKSIVDKTMRFIKDGKF